MPFLDESNFKHNGKRHSGNCEWCGIVFHSPRSNAKYCSDTCRSYAYQARNPGRVKKDKPKTKADLEKELEELQLSFSKYKKESIHFRSGLMTKEIQKIYEKVLGHAHEYTDDLTDIRKDVVLAAIARYLFVKRVKDGAFYNSMVEYIRYIQNNWWLGKED